MRWRLRTRISLRRGQITTLRSRLWAIVLIILRDARIDPVSRVVFCFSFQSSFFHFFLFLEITAYTYSNINKEETKKDSGMHSIHESKNVTVTVLKIRARTAYWNGFGSVGRSPSMVCICLSDEPNPLLSLSYCVSPLLFAIYSHTRRPRRLKSKKTSCWCLHSIYVFVLSFSCSLSLSHPYEVPAPSSCWSNQFKVRTRTRTSHKITLRSLLPSPLFFLLSLFFFFHLPSSLPSFTLLSRPPSILLSFIHSFLSFITYFHLHSTPSAIIHNP